jgi:hypothetical protein
MKILIIFHDFDVIDLLFHDFDVLDLLFHDFDVINLSIIISVISVTRILKPSYDYIVGMYVTLHRILKPSYDYIVGMYVTLHRILKPSGTCHSGCCELPFLSIIYTMDLTN